METKRILSLGAGVQSTAIILMSHHGELPPLDAAVFADTGWETKAVYRHLEWLESYVDIPIYRVSSGNIKEDALRSQVRGKAAHGCRWVSMPYFVLGPQGERGMLRRQCTTEYKLVPVRRKVRELAGYKPRERMPAGCVEQWIGLSFDELRRTRSSPVAWCTNYYPLIDMELTRIDCREWMHAHGYSQPPRSACVGCPFRSDAEWRWLQENEPESFAEAVEFDVSIRTCGGTRGKVFLHSQCIPLGNIDFRRNQT